MKPPIRIERARTHNLRDVTCEIPQQTLTVVTGVSGSGKSSLVFDTLYAEGQRRFVQSMSTYTRLFLDRMERPDVDFISNIPPAIALAQKNTIRNARSTVGTITEINDHLRLLFTHVGETACVACGGRVLRDDPESGLAEIDALEEGAAVLVVAPVALRGIPLGDVVAGLLKNGYRRAWVGGEVVRLDEVEIAALGARLGVSGADASGAAIAAGDARGGSGRKASKAKRGRVGKPGPPGDPAAAPVSTAPADPDAPEAPAPAGIGPGTGVPGDDRGPALPVLMDRLVRGRTSRARCREALDAAFRLGEGRVRLVVDALDDGEADRRTIALDRRFTCRSCGRELPEPTPNLFSFNSPLGACPTCEGFGRVTGIDLEKVIPDERKSLAGGAVVPWQTPANLELQEWMLRTAAARGVRTAVPYAKLNAAERDFVLNGEPRDPNVKRKRGDHRFPGVLGFFGWLEGKRYKTHVRILLARYRGYTPCEACGGQRLRPEALAVRIAGRNIAEVAAMPVSESAAWVRTLSLDPKTQARAARLLAEVANRLSYLLAVGLEYLSLSRQARTLSGGEAQRIHLASALGGALTDTLYCLDEPTVGLHARDSQRLLDVLHRLTGAGNTVVLVEHDPVVIEGADHVIDLGPGGGARGGRVLFAGPPGGLPGSPTETGRRLFTRGGGTEAARGADRVAEGAPAYAGAREAAELRASSGGVGVGAKAAAKAGARVGGRVRDGSVTVRGARENNLRDVTVTFPGGRLTCVTGVSGSGKSSLVEQVLYNGWLRARGQAVEAGACDGIEGIEAYDEVILMTQAPVGRSARSNAVTYLKAYDEIRKLFAATPAARLAKIGPGHFSFNTPGGRCETCSGMGNVTIEMHFMADLVVTCDACAGARFKPQVLAVRWRGCNVNEVLAMTIDEAHEFFSDSTRIRERLSALRSVGLGYLTLGQPTATLSGGEAQRLKLASFIDDAEAPTRRFLVFDEPTTGLHLSDVARLVDVLRALVARGHTVVVVEHNLDFVSAADHVIDLGPEAGESGGRVVATGSPSELAERGGTPTADALRALMIPRSPVPRTRGARATAGV